MTERTLVFKRASLPDDTVLLPPDAVMAVTAVTRNVDGAIVGQHTLEIDPWPITGYTLGLGDPTGQTHYRHTELTISRPTGRETIELARGGELTVTAVSTNEDGHRTQPYLYRTPFDGLQEITVGEYRLRPAGRSHVVLGQVVGKQAVHDEHGDPLGWVPVYDQIMVPETVAAG